MRPQRPEVTPRATSKDELIEFSTQCAPIYIYVTMPCAGQSEEKIPVFRAKMNDSMEIEKCSIT